MASMTQHSLTRKFQRDHTQRYSSLALSHRTLAECYTSEFGIGVSSDTTPTRDSGAGLFLTASFASVTSDSVTTWNASDVVSLTTEFLVGVVGACSWTFSDYGELLTASGLKGASESIVNSLSVAGAEITGLTIGVWTKKTSASESPHYWYVILRSTRYRLSHWISDCTLKYERHRNTQLPNFDLLNDVNNDQLK